MPCFRPEQIPAPAAALRFTGSLCAQDPCRCCCLRHHAVPDHSEIPDPMNPVSLGSSAHTSASGYDQPTSGIRDPRVAASSAPPARAGSMQSSARLTPRRSFDDTIRRNSRESTARLAAAASAVAEPAASSGGAPGSLHPVSAREWKAFLSGWVSCSTQKKSVSWADRDVSDIREVWADRRMFLDASMSKEEGKKAQYGVKTYQTWVPSDHSRATLESISHDEAGGSEPRHSAAEICHNESDGDYVRNFTYGAELGRLSYLGLARDEDAARAPDAALQEAAMSQYAHLDAVPWTAVSDVMRQLKQPIEPGSTLDSALAASRAASEAQRGSGGGSM